MAVRRVTWAHSPAFSVTGCSTITTQPASDAAMPQEAGPALGLGDGDGEGDGRADGSGEGDAEGEADGEGDGEPLGCGSGEFDGLPTLKRTVAVARDSPPTAVRV
jgi:hypothetical protein